jgi:Kdo2-lipid IVA lauroyltransferase/acyltransferase
LGKKGFTKFILHRLEFSSILLVSFFLNALPEKAVYAFVKVLGIFAFRIVRVRRRVTLENLRNALGQELSENDLKKIAEKAYINMGMTFAEMLFFQRLVWIVPERTDMTEISLLNREFYKGGGVILVSGHFGNWELNLAVIGKYGYPLTVVAKKQSNPLVDEYINRNRITGNLQLVSTGAPIKQIIRALRNHEIVGLISDQDSGAKGVFVNFFGRPASTPRGGAELALKYGIPILVMATIRTAPGYYKVLLKEVAVYPDDTVETLTQRYTTILENIIKKYPEQYFWMHRRWKTQPSDLIGKVNMTGTKSNTLLGDQI